MNQTGHHWQLIQLIQHKVPHWEGDKFLHILKIKLKDHNTNSTRDISLKKMAHQFLITISTMKLDLQISLWLNNSKITTNSTLDSTFHNFSIKLIEKLQLYRIMKPRAVITMINNNTAQKMIRILSLATSRTYHQETRIIPADSVKKCRQDMQILMRDSINMAIAAIKIIVVAWEMSWLQT